MDATIYFLTKDAKALKSHESLAQTLNLKTVGCDYI